MVSEVKLVGGLVTVRAAWLAALEVTAALPERTVIVRTEAVAHTWRRDLVAIGRPDLLLGTRFVTPIGAAVAVLERAGVTFTTGEEAVRASRIGPLLHERLRLRAYELEVLRDRPGWSTALAATLNDLEGAGLDVAALRAAADARCTDLAMLLERIDKLAGTAWTTARTLREATARLRADPSMWPYGTPCLAEVSGHETVAMARWLRAIPSIAFQHTPARPARDHHARRLAHLFDAVTASPTEAPTRTERDLLATYLFATPDLLTSPVRPRSTGADGTVHLEEHAGVEAELEAAITWVIGEITDHATPLEQLAIIVPRLDPYAGLLAERLDELGPELAHVAGGLPATGTSAGARFATVLHALAAYLHARSLANVLPILKLTDDDVDLSRKDAIHLAGGLGTSGGSLAQPTGALDWAPRITTQHAALATRIAELGTSDDEETQRQRIRLDRKRCQLAALAPALAALDAAARALVADQPLATLWPPVQRLLAEHVRAGIDGPRIIAALREALRPLLDANMLTGPAALRALVDTLHALRIPRGRFGQPRITIAALHDAVGLTFRSVRVLGLAEGELPSNPREDAVLPDAARAPLGLGVMRTEHRVLAQLHALQRIVAASSERVVLSVARMDLDGRYRGPSGVMIEAAAAVGRPPLGTTTGFIPDDVVMRTAWFEPARTQLAAVRARWPVRERTVLERAAEDRRVPAAWHTDPLRALDRIRPAAAGPTPTPMDGWFPAGPFVALPGESATHPASASSLGKFLECPHRFLYERVLGWSAPPDLGDDGAIDALSYGTLFHAIAEAFYRDHGTPFCAHKKKLDHWIAVGKTLADAQFTTFLATYPLAGRDIIDAQRQRLQRDLRALLHADWETPKRFVDVERAFGPTELTVKGQRVFVRGFIDRLDVVDGTTLVRDLKTGRAKPREGDELMPAYDLQVGLYGLIARLNAKAWGVPKQIAGGYVYPSDASGDERAFHDDFDALATQTEHWIATAARLLRTRTFPRSPDTSDCKYCAFKPVCGTTRNERAGAVLAGAKGAAAEFAALKAGDDE